MAIEGLDYWSTAGAKILSLQEPAAAQRAFDQWSEGVGAWLASSFPNSGIQAAWFSREPVLLVTWAPLQTVQKRVNYRLEWLRELPREVDHRQTMARLDASIAAIGSTHRGSSAAPLRPAAHYVDPERLK